MQPIPRVSNDDVRRIVHRDYPQNLYFTIMEVLEEYRSESWQHEEHRVRLAALKLARGDIDELRRLISTAKKDYRDVIAPAEYPPYSKNRVFDRSPKTASNFLLSSTIITELIP